MNIYVSSDDYGSLIVDAPISYLAVQSYYNTSFDKQTNQTGPFTLLYIDISITETGLDLVSGLHVTVNSTGNKFPILLASITPRTEPYNITITGASGDAAHFYTSSTQLYYLSLRSDGGSIVKIDRLYGGLVVQDWSTNSIEWTSLFPYTYYVSWQEWQGNSIDDMNIFKEAGYNIIHIVPTGTLGDTLFPFDNLTKFIDRAEELGLWLMYDVRWNYANLTPMMEQVDYIKTHKSLLLYYTSNEPDRQTEPINATKIAYDTIKAVDPYHPVSCTVQRYDQRV
jgi:hypothetical protein